MKFMHFFAASFLLATAAHGQNLKASNPQAIAEKIRQIGYKAELDKDDDGDPLIFSAADGSSFALIFYGCEKGRDCEWVQFFKTYKVDRTKYATLKIVTDKWNLDGNLSNAAIDEDSVYLSFSVIMSQEGMGPDLFNANFDTWIREYVEFRKKMTDVHQ